MGDAPPSSESLFPTCALRGWSAPIQRLLLAALVYCFLSHSGWGQILTYEGHNGAVTAVTFSMDGRFMATGCVDGSMQVWDVASRHVAYSLPDRHDSSIRPGDTGAIGALCFSVDGETLYSADAKRKVMTWKVSRAEHLLRSNGSNEVCSMGASRDGRWLVTGELRGRTGPLRTNLTSGQYNEHSHTQRVTGVFWEQDNVHYATLDESGNWKRWGMVPGKEWSHPAAADGMLPPPIPAGQGPCAVSADGRLLAVIQRVEGVPRIALCKFPSGEPLGTMSPSAPGRQDALCIAFARDGRTVATGGIDGKVTLWDLTRTLVTAGVLDAATAGPNLIVQPRPKSAWPALTKQLPDMLNAQAPSVDINFKVNGDDRFVVAIRRVEGGGTEGLDLKVPRVPRGDMIPLKLRVPVGHYVFYWRKLLEPGVVHQDQPLYLHIEEKNQGSTRVITTYYANVTLGGAASSNEVVKDTKSKPK